MRRSTRPAFTRIELLVLIAIATVAGSLVCCKVAMSREANARERCKNNLKTICLAAHNYDSAYGVLPPGLVGAPPSKDLNSDNFPNHGAFAFLLPFMEQEAIYKQFEVYSGGTKLVAGGMVLVNDPSNVNWWPELKDREAGYPDAAWWKNATNAGLARKKISLFLCPADDAYANTKFTSVCTIAGMNQFVNKVVPLDEGGADLGRTNYIANAGAIGYTTDAFYDTYVGPFFSRSKTKLLNIPDGTANAIMFGETLGGESDGERKRALSWMGAGAMPTAFGLAAKSYAWNFSSKHEGCVQFGMCDASVKPIRIFDKDGKKPEFFSNTWYNFQRIGGVIDGEVIDYTTLDFLPGDDKAPANPPANPPAKTPFTGKLKPVPDTEKPPELPQPPKKK